MQDRPNKKPLNELPPCVVDFIRRVTKKMRYRRKVRREVQAELTAHFEDELRDCESLEEREQKAHTLIEEFGDPGLLGVLCRRAKKRCRPLWRKIVVRSGQALGVFVLYLVVCSLPLTLGKPTIRVNYIEWLNNRWRPNAADTANAKPLYDQAAKMYVHPPEPLRAKQANGNAFLRSSVEWLSGYSDEEQEALKRWLEENWPAFDMLRRGSQMAYYWPAYDASSGYLSDSNVVGDSMQAFRGYRQVVLALREQIAWKASEGRIEGALDDCLVLHRFGRHLQGKGFLNDQLVGVSVESLCYDGIALILHRSKVPDPILATVQQELETQFDPGRYVISLDGEKAFWYDNIQRRFTDDGHGGGHVLKQGIPLAAGDWRDNLIGILLFDYPGQRETVAMVERYFEHVQKRFTTPPNKRDSDGALSERDQAGTGNLFLDITEPVHNTVSRQAWRLKTHEMATIILVAIQRYAGDTGGYPAILEQLVARGYLKDLPADPFGRGPLTYKKTDKGFLLYSWGGDLEDDGGRWGTDSQGNPNRWADNGDWVFWPVGP